MCVFGIVLKLQLDIFRKHNTFFYRTFYAFYRATHIHVRSASAEHAKARRLYGHHKPVLYRNGWIYRAAEAAYGLSYTVL